MKKHLAILLIASIAAISTPAYAYLCWGDSSNALGKFNDSDIVFSGKVKSIKEIGANPEELGSMRYNMMFEVGKVWKGLAETDKIIYVDTESIYEYDFKVGQEYLLYAFNLYGNRISVVGCPRAVSVADAEAEIAALGKSLYEVEEVIVEADVVGDGFGIAPVEVDEPVSSESSSVEVIEDSGAQEVPENTEAVGVQDGNIGDSLDDILEDFDAVDKVDVPQLEEIDISVEESEDVQNAPVKIDAAEEILVDVVPTDVVPAEVVPAEVLPAKAAPKPAPKNDEFELMDDLFGDGLDLDDEFAPEVIKEMPKAPTSVPSAPKELKNENSSVNVDNNAVEMGKGEVLKEAVIAPKALGKQAEKQDSSDDIPPDFTPENY